ncbi:MAG: hypothetical protein G01um101419_147 [Parcubacteria group bacterium Gr01-1014_19]|nr:MAG: hypothetical protein G01um101419_147 [Parcubacteria group bacterium Gr01-1014_19]
MHTLRAKSGPFQTRPFYKQDEIERTCSNELRMVGLLPDKPAPVRIDRFIEKRFGVVHQYIDMPEGVLGFSRFGKRGLEEVVVARSLDEDGSLSSERRIRTTLAHEAGHALFQGHLFVLGKKPKALFVDGLDEPKILCRENESSDVLRTGYDGKWWEYQANQAIGSLLLPSDLVEKSIAGLLSTGGPFELKVLDPSLRSRAIEILAEVFNVNPAAAKARLDLLYPALT